MGAPGAEPRCALADPLPSRGLDRRLPGGACGTPRPRRTEPVAFSDRSAERGMAGRVRALATAGTLGTALRVPLGRWRLPAGAHGGACRVHALSLILGDSMVEGLQAAESFLAARFRPLLFWPRPIAFANSDRAFA